MGGSGMAGTGMWGVGFFWPLLWLLIMAIVVVGVVYLFRGWETTGDDEGSDRAIALLREQYARGEISDEEYENRIERLRTTGPP